MPGIAMMTLVLNVLTIATYSHDIRNTMNRPGECSKIFDYEGHFSLEFHPTIFDSSVAVVPGKLDIAADKLSSDWGLQFLK